MSNDYLKDIERDVSKMLHRSMLSQKMRETFEWDKWRKEIPYINFPANFLVKITPPVTNAVIRFRVADKSAPEKGDISVYLDCYDALGYFGAPYWEIYPNKEGDTERYAMNDVDGLIDGLREALETKQNGERL